MEPPGPSLYFDYVAITTKLKCSFMVFNATFNISVILWQLVLLVEEARVLGENH